MCRTSIADRLLLVFAAVLVTLQTSGVAGAEELLSIETRVVLNHVVVVGSITERDGRGSTVSVSETIRGPDNKTWNVIWTENTPEPVLGQDCLLFLSVANDGPNDALHATGCVPLDGTATAYDIALRQVTRREDLLRAARDVGDASAPLIRLPLPHAIRSDPRPRDSDSNLVVPKLRKIETHAREWIRSDDEIWRHAGISAIAHFRSPENIALLEPLLSDTGFDYTTAHYREFRQTRWKTGVSPLRERAWNVLRQWEAPLQAPSFTGPYLPHRPITWASLLPFVAVPALWLSLVAILWNRSRRRADLPFTMTGLVASASTAALVLCVVGIAWLWNRSHRVVDELVWGNGGSHHEVASYRGGLQYVYVPQWRWDNRLRYGTFAPTPTSTPPPRPPTGRSAIHHDRLYARHDPTPPGDVWNLDGYALKTRGHRLGVEWGSGSFEPDFTRASLAYQVLRVPYACIVAPFLLLPLLRIPTQFRRRRPLRKGLCPRCAYDLHVTPNACPECGWRSNRKAPASPHDPEPVPQAQSV